MHLAAESHVDRSIDGPKAFIESNIVGTFNLLQSCLSHYRSSFDNKKIFRFHHVSTDEVFGSLGNDGSFNEGTPYAPRSPYSSSKAASDHLVRAWNETYKLPTVITNCSNNFGPYQFPEKLIPLAILKLIRGEKVPLYGDGANIRDWIYVGDHVNALLKVAEKGKISEEYNEEKLKEYMKWDDLKVEVNLKLGQGSFECYTCDLTNDYININTDYRN